MPRDLEDASGLDYISLSVTVEERVPASVARVTFVVDCKSVLRSSEAARAAGEVAALVKALEPFGVTAAQVAVVDASAVEGKGLTRGGSAARLTVEVRELEPDALVGVLQAATELPHTTHRRTDWSFDFNDAVRQRMIRAAGAQLRADGEAVAEAMGCRVVGTHRVQLEFSEARVWPLGDEGMDTLYEAKRSRVESVADATGVPMQKHRVVTAEARAKLRIESLAAS